MKENRLNNIIKSMEKNDLKQMLITSPASIFYLTGKWIEPGERLLALYIDTKGERKLFVNELFPINEDLGVEIIVYNDTQDAVAIMTEYIDNNYDLGIEKQWPAHFLIALMEKKAAKKFVNASPLIDRVRMIKDLEEIELMRKSSAINDRVMEKVIKVISEDHEEKVVCRILADLYEKEGAEGFSFYPLIAYGKNAAEPHHDSDRSRLTEGDTVIIDIGGRKDYYCSDMTRTVFYKKAEEKSKEVYNTVLEANRKAIAKVAPGVRFSEIDRAAREVIENAGYGKYFTHRTGHNIGIEVHEFGDVSSSNNETVQPGMIFSIEPGIYLPGSCGVRIEDLVLVTDTGVEVLNSYSKELEVI